MSTAISVGYSVDSDGRGYRVEVDGDDGQPIDVYHNGNDSMMSESWLPADHVRALSARTLRRLARQTACEFAAEHGLTEGDVYEEQGD